MTNKKKKMMMVMMYMNKKLTVMVMMTMAMMMILNDVVKMIKERDWGGRACLIQMRTLQTRRDRNRQSSRIHPKGNAKAKDSTQGGKLADIRFRETR